MIKPYVTKEQNICTVCGEIFDTGSIFLDNNMKERYEVEPLTGMGLCPQDKEWHDNGYLALVCIDKSKSAFNKDRINPKDAYRLGRIAHLKRDFADKMLEVDPETLAYPVMFVESDFMDQMEELSATSNDDQPS